MSKPLLDGYREKILDREAEKVRFGEELRALEDELVAQRARLDGLSLAIERENKAAIRNESEVEALIADLDKRIVRKRTAIGQVDGEIAFLRSHLDAEADRQHKASLRPAAERFAAIGREIDEAAARFRTRLGEFKALADELCNAGAPIVTTLQVEVNIQRAFDALFAGLGFKNIAPLSPRDRTNFSTLTTGWSAPSLRWTDPNAKAVSLPKRAEAPKSDLYVGPGQSLADAIAERDAKEARKRERAAETAEAA